jgi:hypothetical protein
LRTLLLAIVIAALSLVSAFCQRVGELASPKSEALEVRRELQKGPIRVRLILDKDAISIAETLNLTLAVDMEQGYDVELPAFGEKLGQFGILDCQEDPVQLTKEGRLLKKKICKLEPFLAGDYLIEPIKVVFYPSLQGTGEPDPATRHEIETEPLTVRVRSLLGEERGELQVYPIWGPVALGGFPIPLSYLLVGIAFVAATGAALVWLRRRRRLPQPTIPALTAYEMADLELTALLREDLIDRGEVKEFFFKLSDVIRRYLENRFGLHAPKCTTEEFLARIASNAPFSSHCQKLLDDFLHRCDLVKFAEYRPIREDIQSTVEAGRVFLEATRNDSSGGRGPMSTTMEHSQTGESVS